MNVWGVLISGVGFLLLYMGIKNKSTSSLVNEFRPQAAPTAKATPGPTNLPGTTPLAPTHDPGTNGGIPGLFGGVNVPPGSLGGVGGFGLA